MIISQSRQLYQTSIINNFYSAETVNEKIFSIFHFHSSFRN